MSGIVPEQILQTLLDEVLLKSQTPNRVRLVGLVMFVIAAALWIVFGRKRHEYRVTAVYWLGCGIGLWLVFHLYQLGRLRLDQILPVSAAAISIVSLSFVALPVWRNRQRRNRAWPDRLEDLLIEYRPSSSLVTSMTGMALVVFFLALCQVTSLISAVSALMMGLALLIVVEHLFRLEAALAGLVHLSLAIVSGVLVVCVLFGVRTESIPTLMNIVVIVLALLAFLWIWLGLVWGQQILAGRPLTTAGRLVPLTVHVGTMLLGFASLVLLKITLWRKIPAVHGWDNDLVRLVLLGIAGVLVLASNFWIAKKFSSRTLGYLLIFNIVSIILAYALRWPWLFNWQIIPYWPLWLAGLSAVILALGWVFRSLSLKFLAEPSAAVAIALCITVLVLNGLAIVIPGSRRPVGFELASVASVLLIVGGWRIHSCDRGPDPGHLDRQ